MEGLEKYLQRCMKSLKNLDAPLTGWECQFVYDSGDDDFPCSLCGCSHVRYVHVMRNPNYPKSIEVGCVCAGIMEGDVLKAKERERKFVNRQKRKSNFLKKQWSDTCFGWALKYKGAKLKIKLTNNYKSPFEVSVLSKSTRLLGGRVIRNFTDAVNAAFELLDGPEVN